MRKSGATSKNARKGTGGTTFGRLAVAQGYCTQEQLDDALKTLQQLRARGVDDKIGNVLVRKGYLTPQRIQEILKLQGKRATVRVAGYEILAKIGQGGMGAVFKARQVSLDRIVALKILSPKLAADKKFCERFITEARAVARLNHPNIITGIDVGRSEKYFYFAMEYVDGRTALELLREKGPFEERRALEIAEQIARALEHAHTHGFVHRDVKPDNIMITKKGEAKLCDLGLAKQFDQEPETEGAAGSDAALTQAGTAVGTPHYISPEQARGRKDVDITADIYSLGASLYHMVTGRTMFLGSAASVMAQHLSDRAPYPRALRPNLSEGFCRLLARMLAKEPADRYRTPAALREALDKLLMGAGGPALLPPGVKTSLEQSPRFSARASGGTRKRTGGPLKAVGGRRATTGPRAPVGRPDATTGARKPVGSPSLWLAVGGGAAAVLVLVGLWFRGGSPRRHKPRGRVTRAAAERPGRDVKARPVSTTGKKSSTGAPNKHPAAPAAVSSSPLARLLAEINKQPNDYAGNLEKLRDLWAVTDLDKRAPIQAEIDRLSAKAASLLKAEYAKLDLRARRRASRRLWGPAMKVYRPERLPEGLRTPEALNELSRRKLKVARQGFQDYRRRFGKKLQAEAARAEDNAADLKRLSETAERLKRLYRDLPAVTAELDKYKTDAERRLAELGNRRERLKTEFVAGTLERLRPLVWQGKFTEAERYLQGRTAAAPKELSGEIKGGVSFYLRRELGAARGFEERGRESAGRKKFAWAQASPKEKSAFFMKNVAGNSFGRRLQAAAAAHLYGETAAALRLLHEKGGTESDYLQRLRQGYLLLIENETKALFNRVDDLCRQSYLAEDAGVKKEKLSEAWLLLQRLRREYYATETFGRRSR